jgi:hypothetical protein
MKIRTLLLMITVVVTCPCLAQDTQPYVSGPLPETSACWTFGGAHINKNNQQEYRPCLPTNHLV